MTINHILLLFLFCLCILLYSLIPSQTINSIPQYNIPKTQKTIVCTVPKSTFPSLDSYYSYFIHLLKGELQKSVSNETTQTIHRAMKGLATFTTLKSPLVDCILTGKQENNNRMYPDIYSSIQNNKLTLIQGPPGTGKTYTSAEMITKYINEHPNHHILICAPSNDPLVALKEKVVANTTKNVSIYYSYTYSKANKEYTDNDPYNLMNKMKEMKKNTLYTEKEILAILLSQTNILFTTCTSILEPMFTYQVFDLILIDEASRCIEPEAILPLLKSSYHTKCVLVGDDKQLGPVITSENVKKCLSISLFKRLIDLKTLPTYTLNIQYRMHPDISKYSYPFFYTTPIKNYDSSCSSSECRDWYDKHTIFVQNVLSKYSKQRTIPSSILSPSYITGSWIDNITPETIIDNYTYINTGEVETVCNLVKECINSGIDPSQITVLVPYKRQMTLFECIPDVSVKTIDSYQGRDNDVVILSLVRSNDKREIGFLAEIERINVALTRAKRVLFVVGNKALFSSSSKVWKQITDLF